ncbi:hypothetical protein ACFLZN_00400 [Nanoarchaeota archaeon]
MKRFFIFIGLGIMMLLLIGLGASYFAQKLSKVNADHQLCDVDDDCVLQILECSCDCGVPINKQYREDYARVRSKNCENYQGAICKMACDIEAFCVAGVCKIRNTTG